MTGKGRVTVPKQTAAASQLVPVSIDVARAVAKVTLHFTKSGLAAPKDIVIKKVTLHNGADRVGLFETPAPNPAEYDIQTECATFNSYDGTAAVGTLPEKNSVTPVYCIPLDTFYTYENLADRDKSRATWFELDADVGGVSRKGTVYLAQNELSATDTVWNVIRNYWYDVYVDIIDPGFDSVKITVKSSPWHLADTQKVIVGGGYEVMNMASPLKLVKNYTANEMNTDEKIAMVEQHTKGASWIDLRVANGSSWALDFEAGRPENVGAVMSLDSGAWTTGLSGTSTSDEPVHRIYIYRPYVENAEPTSGPTFSLTVSGVRVRDFVVQPRDTTPIPTNCYILRPALTGAPTNKTHAYIPLEGVYRYWEDYLLANGAAIPDGTVSAELLWQDSLGVINPSTIRVLNANRRDSAYIYAEAGAVQGNAVIAMKVGGVIYWSFHLWVTEYNPYEAAGQKYYGSGTIKNVFMDRNLGALSNKPDAEGDARGLYYQFGRKDPFPRGKDWGNVFKWFNGSGVSLGTSLTVVTSLSPSTDVRPLAAIPEVLRNPTTFYHLAPWPLSLENDSLWDTHGGNKTAFDPCPEGWRVPPQRGSGTSDSPWGPFTTPAILANGATHAQLGYFPFSGYLSSGSITNVLTQGYFWTSYKGDALNVNATGLHLSSGGVNLVPQIAKHYGVSVRCIVDTRYLITVQGGGLFGNSAGEMPQEIL
jgi:hypothetical protein